MRSEKQKYRSLAHTIEMIGVQVRDSLDYAKSFVPRYTSIDELWRILKDNLVYKHDPPGVELLQSFPSLMNDNYWGIPGAGDCDCFTIAALSCAWVSGFPCRAVVVGNSSEAPSHIYAEVFDRDKQKWVIFDLVNDSIGVTKYYRYKTIIRIHA